MSSASEAELGALFITAQEMVAIQNTQEEMKWSQPTSPIHTDNSAAEGVVNNTIVTKRLEKLTLSFSASELVEAAVHFLKSFGNNSIIHYALCVGVVRMDG